MNLQAQTFFEKDSVFNVKRTAWTSGVIGAGWLGSVVSLKNIWYKENWTNKFHTFDDSKQWLGMDKVGHFYTGNMITKNISSVYDWSGMNRSQRLIIGSTVGFGYLTTLEILDGYSEEWGFSWADLGANALGVAWYVWQDLVWEEQRFKLKFSAHLTPYASYRPEVLGSSFPERLLKDYNGQTYWLSFTPSQFLNSSSFFPNWLSFSFGYSVDKKLHGDLNVYNHIDSKLGIETFNAERQFLFSLDIDFEQFSPEKNGYQPFSK
ncbi:DUF2279 domain-containing protein [Brumimicrobium salinarum]|uniref:DUF2279 domain-containing protein n=1 Tax=Brumimicrobium salinarum TaxID=2058658 RepID=A0A2I0R1N0_9FLAO|nr:DUF2279 domain-containing protein [Brumimicrobium salinarum]